MELDLAETRVEFEMDVAEELRELEAKLLTVAVRRDRSQIEVLRSSVWVEREGQWQVLFHQGTRVGA